MRGTTLIMIASLLLAGMLAPGAAAKPEPPECYDRQPIVDAGVASVWLTRSCSVRVETNDGLAAPDAPEPAVPHKDVYLPKGYCPSGWGGEYVPIVSTPVATVHMWRCTTGPPP